MTAKTVSFKVTLIGDEKLFAWAKTAGEAEENMVDVVGDGLGFPDGLAITAELLPVEPEK